MTRLLMPKRIILIPATTLAVVVVALAIGIPPWAASSVKEGRDTPGPLASAPKSPMSVEVTISGAPKLGAIVDLEITVSTAQPAPITGIRTHLPEGFSLVGGNLNWLGALWPGRVVHLSGKVKAIQTGEWVIETRAAHPAFGELGFGDVQRLFITVGTDTATVSYQQPPPRDDQGIQISPTSPPPQPVPPGVVLPDPIQPSDPLAPTPR